MTRVRNNELARKPRLNKTSVANGVSTLQAVLEQYTQSAKKTELFKDDANPIYIQVAPFKIPQTLKVELRVTLPNSLSIDKDTCLIVKNIKTGKKNDYERTINHYQNLLKDIGIQGNIVVIPIGQLCDEHKQHEERSKFAKLYDTFLVDGRLIPVAGRTLGIRFSRSGKHLIPVKMDTKGLKKRLETALNKSVMTVHAKGDTFSMKVAYTTMTKEQISQNILSALKDLTQPEMFPGGIENIRAVHIKTARSLAIPVFISRSKHNKVAKPVTKVKIPKAYKVEEGELTTIFGGIVRVNPEGDVHFRKHLTKEDRKLLADDDSDALAEDDETKEEMKESGSEDEAAVKESKAPKRKLAADEESDDDDDEVEAAEESYLIERENEEKKSAAKTPKKGKTSPKTKKPRNKKK